MFDRINNILPYGKPLQPAHPSVPPLCFDYFIQKNTITIFQPRINVWWAYLTLNSFSLLDIELI